MFSTTLYLSRLLLDPNCPRVLTDLFSPYEMHRTLSRAFSGPLQGGRVLFRVDHDPQRQLPQVLVQSPEPPDWGFLEEANGYLADAPPGENPRLRSLVLTLTPGQVLAFRLRAAPTFKRGRRRLAWLRRDDQLAWLRRQGLRHGFATVAVTVTPEGPLWCRKRHEGRPCAITLRPVLFTGFIRVTHAEALAAAVAAGLGSGKAFGCGLLSLAPPP